MSDMLQLLVYALMRPFSQKIPPDPQAFSTLLASGENELKIPLHDAIRKKHIAALALPHRSINRAFWKGIPSLFMLY